MPVIRTLALAGALAALIGTTGCARIREHQGYIAEQVLVDSIEAGVDNRNSVVATLGRPSFVSQFTTSGEAPTWYYVTRNTRQLAFANPSPISQSIIAVNFDGNGDVASVRDIGLEQVASIDPYGTETPTLGRSHGFFQELFGNIGQVGSVARGGSTADNPDGN